ncbi:ABC transporter permease [Aquamicrobium sp. NLF2-7]|uniref:ABC transporter permease n=1 Tax=Aquamicrobium sp. NLF2-7 TaxID=2918753 RepID=UPI001EFABB6C|nr:ABC transporter permease [Aquamicrobium sp. NLF2-7]MCG8274424.1 ABC transporter permease [Aquamicrobium sp. NLF2-7]
MSEITYASSQIAENRDLKGLVARYGFIIFLVLLIAGLSAAMPNFLDASNIRLMLRGIAISALMFLGLTWVIASGKIDVSFMDCAALTTMVCATMVVSGHGWLVASLAGLSTGMALGAMNGLLIGYVGLPPLITTIATGSLARSLAWVLGSGASLPLTGSGGFVHNFIGTNIGVVPLLTIVTLCIYVLAWFAQDKLTFGRYLYALERNERAVIEAGISARGLTLGLFIFSGFCASVAGILLTANLNSGQPALGASYFLDGLTAVLLGAIVAKIGKPNVIGTFTGVTFLAVLVSAGAMLGWQNYVREIIKGVALLIGIIVIFSLKRRQNHASAH